MGDVAQPGSDVRVGGASVVAGRVTDAVGNLPDGQRLLPRYNDGYAIYRLTYSHRDYVVATDAQVRPLQGGELRRYVTRADEPSLEALPLNRLVNAGATKLMFLEGPFAGQVIAEAGVKQLATSMLTYTWHQVPDRPLAAHANCVGKVNAGPFDGFGGAPLYPAGTLLCLPWRTRRETGVAGRVHWTITFRFAFRPTGWNRFPAGDGRFYLATFTKNTDGDPAGDPVYAAAKFGNLFVPAPPERYL